ncbi:MAG: hypothetical protein C4B55_02570 [Candidatus Methanophagaceae archaeon]|nr:MAG: hypothetical protein C4B55_02570 [Methanophagales archaeon]
MKTKSKNLKRKAMALAICTVFLVAVSGAVAGTAEESAAEGTDQIYLHSNLSALKPIENPVYTDWHELYPTYCNWYNLSGWRDNGDDVLSPCDSIELTDADGKVGKYHVDEVTVTITVVPVDAVGQAKPTYLDFTGGYDDIKTAMYEPPGTIWHEIYPRFCQKYELQWWKDNGDQHLSYCDYIGLLDKTGAENPYHVEEVTIDIIVTPEPTTEKPDLVVEKKWEEHGDIKGTYTVSYVIHNKGTATAPAGHHTTLYVDGEAIEHKPVPVALRPCQTYEDTFRTVVKCTPPEDKITVCADNFGTIDELDETNNCLTNIWKCPGTPPVPEISVTTDKFEYCPCNTMVITININNPTKNPVTFKWYLGAPTLGYWAKMYSMSIPAGYKKTFTVEMHVEKWSETPFSAVWYVDLQDPETGKELAADCACWSYAYPYCPKCESETTPTSLQEIAIGIEEQIKGGA